MKPLALHIRQARASDAVTLSALAVAAKQHWAYSVEDIESWRRLLTVRQDDLVSKPAFVAELDGEVAGFYVLAPDGTMWELEHLWVSPPFMRRGVGRALLAHAALTARSGGASSIAIDADPNAEPFYLACGAAREGSIAAPIASNPARVRPQLSLRC
jgi:GNAT superfamily N-acetyltransferase